VTASKRAVDLPERATRGDPGGPVGIGGAGPGLRAEGCGRAIIR